MLGPGGGRPARKCGEAAGTGGEHDQPGAGLRLGSATSPRLGRVSWFDFEAKHNSGDSHCSAQRLGALPSPHTVTSEGPTSAGSFPALSPLPGALRASIPEPGVPWKHSCPEGATADAAPAQPARGQEPGASLEHPRSILGAHPGALPEQPPKRSHTFPGASLNTFKAPLRTSSSAPQEHPLRHPQSTLQGTPEHPPALSPKPLHTPRRTNTPNCPE